MKLAERIHEICYVFSQLEAMNGRNDKQYILNKARSKDNQLCADINYCLEVLDGRHKIGYKVLGYIFHETPYVLQMENTDASFESFVQPLFESDKSEASIEQVSRMFGKHAPFVASIFNREWRLGIGKSQLAKAAFSPMLAKKYDPAKRPAGERGYTITEKLDGNRCIAFYDGVRWVFYSRSGKQLKCTFDMSHFAPDRAYDGEILSMEQKAEPSQENFNALSGLINSNREDKSTLIYTIFDIIDTDEPYHVRRAFLNSCVNCESSNVRVLPVLATYDTWEQLNEGINKQLESVVSRGGEGVVINVNSAKYQQKRTDALLKYKEVQTMDMRVMSIEYGTGKNEGLVGSLSCYADDDETGCWYTCNVGSGIDDYHRQRWTAHPEEILDKIIEVQYFSTSQSITTRGTKEYALRFPRFKQVRQDKSDTSIF